MTALAFLTGCATCEKHESEIKITMDQLPAVVKTIAEKEIAGGQVSKVEQETKDGKVVYEISYKEDGKEMKLKYAEDGKLLRKGRD